jgi:GNAT superfamily N-acetyltransferase
MPVRVRPVEPHDTARWLELFHGYITFYEAEVPEPVIAVTWQRLLSGSDNMVGLVAVDETNTPLGFASLVFHRSTWSESWYCYLEDLFVDPAVRGSGAGRALIEAAYAEADRRGASRTYWATAETNARARILYDRIGELTPFVQYRRKGEPGAV